MWEGCVTRMPEARPGPPACRKAHAAQLVPARWPRGEHHTMGLCLQASLPEAVTVREAIGDLPSLIGENGLLGPGGSSPFQGNRWYHCMVLQVTSIKVCSCFESLKLIGEPKCSAACRQHFFSVRIMTCLLPAITTCLLSVPCCPGWRGRRAEHVWRLHD